MLGPVKERKWESSGSAQPRSRLPSALKRPVAAEADGRWARPPSAVRPPSTRPDSRRSRPGSRMDSRPDSRLDSGHQEIVRPKSGVRPLSGKVYMRRTNDHGWVAKAYNVSEQMRVESQTEVNLFDDLSDGSLDSFFDDDFDVQTSEEKLGPLLSCNTLGVEAKGNRPDWVSGKLGLPEFHCPRCRDHWYGVTDVPCDEELARLIREGLWRTGKEEGGGGGGGKHRRRRELSKGDQDRDYRSYSTDSLTSKSSKTKLNRKNENGEKSQHRSSLTNEENERKKPKKRITFKLDNELESSGSNSGSNTQLEGSGTRRLGRGARDYKDKLSSSNGRQSGLPNGASEQDNGMNGLKYHSGDDHDSSDKSKSDERGSINSKERKAGAHIGNEKLDFDNSGLLDDIGGRKNKTDKNSKGSVGGLMQFNAGNKTKESEQSTNGLQEGQTAYGTNGSVNNTHSHNLKDSEKNLTRNTENFTNDGTNDSNTFTNTNGTENTSTENLTGNKNDSHKRGGQKADKTDSTLSSSSQVRSTGSRRGSLSMEDHGKKVRKPGGYMRAVSPSASDWGDPAHARSFISSTATSRSVSHAGSLVNLGRAEDEEEERISLPPIVPAINSKKPLLDFSDIMGGFQFTRAWTFSYHK